MIVKLIESVNRIQNVAQIIATIETQNNEQYLGICKFFLKDTDTLPENEDELCYFLEDLQLDWESYTPALT